ncbi:MAG: PglZ domain-containing protein [Spirochaetota bacterium]
MKFSEHVRDYLLTERLAASPALVVRDPAERYRRICEELADHGVGFVDANDAGTAIRGDIARHWQEVLADRGQRLIVYRGSSLQNQPDDQTLDPLAAFEAVMGVFPSPGKAREDYRSLAQDAYPDKPEEIDRLFSGGEPAVAALDSLATGATYPTVGGVTGRSGPAEMLVVLLGGSVDALDDVLASSGGRAELAELVGSTVGLDLETVPTAAGELQVALWDYLLFSEFALDLPGGVPRELSLVACAPANRKEAVFAICNRLRSDARDPYLDHADRVQRKFDLLNVAEAIEDFGVVDTFAFENAAALRAAVRALAEGAPPIARKSIWAEHDFTLQSTWEVLSLATGFLEKLDHYPASDAGTDALTWYRESGAQVDRAYRSFVLSYSRLEDESPYGANLADLYELIGERYRAWAGQVQARFAAQVADSGWPLPGLARQDRVFKTHVQKPLDAQKRVAYFLVDALRYELGEALAEKLDPPLRVARDAAAALLPTKTALGMAALCPDEKGPLTVDVSSNALTVSRGSTRLAQAKDRDALFSAHSGDRAMVETLETWLLRKDSKKIDDAIRLAVVRSTEIDAAGEQVDSMFRSALENLMAQLARAVRKAFTLGFDVAVISADHGFLFLPPQGPGDQIAAPGGTILAKGDRYVVGKLEGSDALLTFDSASLGYDIGDNVVAFPKSLATFAKCGTYQHGGLSLQESLVPVLTVEQVATTPRRKVTVTLEYRGKKRARVTSLTPTVTIAVEIAGTAKASSGSLFDDDWAHETVDVALTLRSDSSPGTVGEIGPNEFLDTDTGYLRIRAGTRTTIPLRLNDEHRGEFTVDAVDPQTNKRYDSVTLDVDILE